MTIKGKLRIICLIFSIIPLVIIYWLGGKSGLTKNGAFENGVALALMSAIFIGLFSSGFVRYWFFGKQLEKIKKFCFAVQNGCYDVFLPVPNECSDIEDENEMVELMRNMNWMAHHIKINEDQLQTIVKNLEQSKEQIQYQNDQLEKAYAEQVIVQEQLEERKNELTGVVHKIRTLLDHAGQGFISFGKDLKVAGEYSAECIMIFNREIGGEHIQELLSAEDEQQQKFLVELFQRIFDEKDDFLRQTYFSLLPNEIIVDENYIHINYKFITHSLKADGKEIMVVLTNVTTERQMEQQIQEEKEVLSMVVKVVTQYTDFSDAVQGYTDFCHQEFQGIWETECSEDEKLSTLFRLVHTWKGTFGQLGMQYIVKQLHELEAVLAALRDKDQGKSMSVSMCLASYPTEELYSWLEYELQILQGILGTDFLLKKDMVTIEKQKLYQIQEDINQLPDSSQKQALMLAFESLGYKPLREFFQTYPQYTMELAKRYDKEVKPFTIVGGDVLVDPEKYHDVTKSMIHVFRNAVAHGLETVDERVEMGKEEQGSVECSIHEHDGNLVITIKDDGYGVDAEKMRRVALGKGIYDEQTIAALPDEEAIKLIFADGLSSQVCADEISGRGVGLYAVRQEVEKLGGKAEVVSELGWGTEFRFVLPLQKVV